MACKLKIPPSFSVIKRENTTIFVKKGYKEIILPIAFDTNPPHNRNQGNIDVKFGRGDYLSIPVVGNGNERLIIKNCRHGGFLGKLFGPIFYKKNRSLREIYINEIASQKGVPSAEVIAIIKRKLWGAFYRTDFISKEISGAVDLAQFLKDSSLKKIFAGKKSIIFVVARLIRDMHDAGIYHADLHLKNILLKEEPHGKFHAYIIDFDKSTISHKLSIEQKMKNLLRLNRSLEKLRWFSGKMNISQKVTKGYKNTSHLSFLCKSDEEKNLSSDEKCRISTHRGKMPEEGKILISISLSEKIDSISKTDRIRFFKSYMSHNNTIDRNWKLHLRQYHSSYSFHKLWWHLLGFSRK